MAKKNQRIFTILGAAVGTGLAAYGIRRGMRWYQHNRMANRRLARRLDTQLTEGSWPEERAHSPIPATGPLGATPPMTATAGGVNSDLLGDFDDRGTAFSGSEMSEELTDVDYPVISSEAFSGATPELREARDTWAGETTGSAATGVMGGIGDSGADAGMGGSRISQPVNVEPFASRPSDEIVMDEFAAPLIEHAIAFNSVMNLLRSRQRDGEGREGIESLTTGDRNSMRAVLDQMQEHVIEHDEATIRKDALARRSHELTRKMRDALDNLNYSGADLFRLYDEVRRDLCGLSRELEKSGKVTITGLDQIRQLYECQDK
jgi:hypothetical protein